MHRPRSPGVAYALLTLVLIVLVATVALTARTPPPPTIAEFAPQAVENISDAPDDQSSKSGRPGGEGPGGLQTPSPEPEQGPQTIEVPRVRKCVGDPPRQIEDPQSPPCVPYWSGNNGGATSKGVTADEIRVVAPNWDDVRQPALQAFFNKRFEFYGRRLEIKKLADKKCDDAATVRADAVRADAFEPFATTINDCRPSYHYYLELADKGVISASSFPEFDEERLAERRPYLWQYHMPVDSMFAALGRWGCARLAGRNADYAGAGSLGRPRKFGIIMEIQNLDIPLDSTALEDELARCGVRAEKFRLRSGDGEPPDAAPNGIIRLKDAGVTTVFCLCHPVTSKVSGGIASQQSWFPEWLLSSYFINDTNWWIRNTGLPPEQRVHALGLSFQPRQISPDKMPSRWAMQEGNPSYSDQSSSTFMQLAFIEYRSLLLLASGIQMAGPRLTPETFEQGLFRTRFPNPDHPNMAGKVGFTTKMHGMTLDAAEFWWSESGVSPYADEQSGALCYLDGGARHSLDTWPKTDGAFFQPPCNSQ